MKPGINAGQSDDEMNIGPLFESDSDNNVNDLSNEQEDAKALWSDFQTNLADSAGSISADHPLLADAGSHYDSEEEISDTEDYENDQTDDEYSCNDYDESEDYDEEYDNEYDVDEQEALEEVVEALAWDNYQFAQENQELIEENAALEEGIEGLADENEELEEALAGTQAELQVVEDANHELFKATSTLCSALNLLQARLNTESIEKAMLQNENQFLQSQVIYQHNYMTLAYNWQQAKLQEGVQECISAADTKMLNNMFKP